MKGQYIGNKIFEAHDVCKAFGDLKILESFSYVFLDMRKWVSWETMEQESLHLSKC